MAAPKLQHGQVIGAPDGVLLLRQTVHPDVIPALRGPLPRKVEGGGLRGNDGSAAGTQVHLPNLVGELQNAWEGGHLPQRVQNAVQELNLLDGGKHQPAGREAVRTAAPLQKPGYQVGKLHISPLLHDHLVVQGQIHAFKRHVGGLFPAAAPAGARTHHMQKPQGRGVRIAAAFQHLPRPGPQGLHAEHGTRLVGGIGKLPDVGIHPAFRILRTGELTARNIGEQQPSVRGSSRKQTAGPQSHAVQKTLMDLRIEIGNGQLLQGNLRTLIVPGLRLVPSPVVRSRPLEPHVMAGRNVGHMAAGQLLARLHGSGIRHAVHGVPVGEGNLPFPVQAAGQHVIPQAVPPRLPRRALGGQGLVHGIQLRNSLFHGGAYPRVFLSRVRGLTSPCPAEELRRARMVEIIPCLCRSRA